MSYQLTFITGNPGKAEQVGRYLKHPVAHKKVDLVEIQSLDLKEIVEQKAKEAYRHVKKPVLVEDTSLVFSALGKLPGPFIKWFSLELDNNGLCKLLGSSTKRDAVAEVCFGFYDGKVFKTFTGKIAGTIAKKPRGTGNFGWGSIFIPNGYTKTWGEMTLEEQSKTSMRKIALKKLEKFLRETK